MLLAELRARVADAGRSLVDAGLVRGTSGNVSARDAASGLVAVTPSGAGYDTMSAADVVVTDLAGVVVEGEWEPTSELGLHLGLYRARPEVGAVVHTHSPFATTFAALREPVPAVHYILAKAGSTVPVADYARYGSAELAANCVSTLGSQNGVLLANHGVVAVGTGLAQAMAVAEAIETTAEIAWRARVIGNPVQLTDEEMDSVRRDFGSYGQASRRTAPSPS
ncbi:MAG: class II aldolase/adducin family protein [Motilibacteraceae bacterium]